MVSEKICSNSLCAYPGSPQALSNFNSAKHHSDGLSSRCKKCINSYHKERKDKKREYDKQYRAGNVYQIKENKKKDYEKHGEKIRKRSSDWFRNNRGRANLRNKNRLNSDVQYKLSVSMRIRLNAAIKNNQKMGSAISDLGCSVDFLKLYLESLFQPGMTWGNRGYHGWHIDHIKPLRSFNLENREDFLKACHYTNLQPLWAKDNLKKSGKTAND